MIGGGTQMRREWLLVGVGVLILCVVGIVPVLAQGPDQNPILATIEYVDQAVTDLYEYIDQKVAELYAYVDEQIGGGGGGGPDFDLPPAEWYSDVYYMEAPPTPQGVPYPRFTIGEPTGPTFLEYGCRWNGSQMTWLVDGRALAAVQPDGPEAYGTGTCVSITFQEFPTLTGGETIDIYVTFFWMGAVKEAHWVANCGQLDPNWEFPYIECTLHDAP
jgi:hypothetical protein